MKKFLLLSALFMFALNLFAQSQTEEFFEAVEEENVTKVERLVKGKFIDVDARDGDGRTAFIRSAMQGKAKMLPVLKGLGADVNAADDNGQTALIHAAERGYIVTVPMLLKLGTNKNAKDKRDMTALMYAEAHGRTKTVEILKELDINLEDTGSRQRLSAYVGSEEFNDDADLVRAVFSKFFDDIKKNEYEVPLHDLAIIAREENIVFMKKVSVPFPELYKPITFLEESEAYFNEHHDGCEEDFFSLQIKTSKIASFTKMSKALKVGK